MWPSPPARAPGIVRVTSRIWGDCQFQQADRQITVTDITFLAPTGAQEMLTSVC